VCNPKFEGAAAVAEALAQTRTSLQQKIHSNGKDTGVGDLIQTLRILAGPTDGSPRNRKRRCFDRSSKKRA